jgi:cytochrome c biogenesis protein CcmG, thiol:disulfide interchange protein DsbE
MAARARLGAQIAAVGAVAALLALLVWKVVSEERGDVGAQLARGESPRAPAFDLPRLDENGKLSLASLRGKAVVVNFWASWCAPCKEEVPLLEAAWKRYRDRGLVVVGIDAQDFSGDARTFARKNRITYPIVHDGPGDSVGDYQVVGFPETFFVDRAGQLVGEHISGPVEEDALNTNIELALG